MKFITRLCCFYLLLFGIAFGEVDLLQVRQHEVDITGSFSDFIKISQYKLISQKRINENTFEFSYKAKATNISSLKLKQVIGVLSNGVHSIGTGNIKGTVNIIEGLFSFGTIDVGETKESLNTLILQSDRSAPIDLENLIWEGDFLKGLVLGQDTKGNQITLFLMSFLFEHPENFTLTENNNPTNHDVSNFSSITNQFLGIHFSIENTGFNTDIFAPFEIEIKYIENPFRLLLLHRGWIEWAQFINNKQEKIVEFRATPQNNQIIFELIRKN